MSKPEPLALNLDNLTQEQFNRALNSGSRCAYSGPCILGAMMPDEFVAVLDTITTPSLGGTLDSASIDLLAALGLVTFPDDEQRSRASRVQGTFDGFKSDGHDADRLARLAELLPHIVVPTTPPVNNVKGA